MSTTLGMILLLLLLLLLLLGGHHVSGLAPQSRRSLPAAVLTSSPHERDRWYRRRRRRSQVVTTTTRFLSDKTRGGTTAIVRKQQRRGGVDWTALGKYAIGMATQLSLLYGLFRGLDQVVVVTRRLSVPPFFVNVVLFYLLNANTGRFNPLSKQVKPKIAKEFRKPAWTPPGWVFAVMWPLFVFGTRAVTAAVMVQTADGRYATTAIMSLMLHLSFGNLWNTVYVKRSVGWLLLLLLVVVVVCMRFCFESSQCARVSSHQ